MEDYLIVDGYNVINSWEILKKLKDLSYEHAREKLVSLVANYAGLYGVRATIVFDAHQVKGGMEKQEIVSGVLVVFSKEGETADMVIERIIGDFPKHGLVCVVTSDWTEQQMILGKGAVRLSAREFWERVEKCGQKATEIIEKKPSPKSSLDQLLNEEVRAVLEKWRRKK
ncbi:MAG: NYN domain-containing protein [Bacillota bacterium]|nr:NYN domain-containing protein [Bacillota bacterium]